MSKEHFSDDAEDLSKALHYISNAKKYFEMLAIDKSYEVKNLFNLCVNKCVWIENQIFDRLSEENRVTYKRMLLTGDTLFFDAISEKLLQLPEEKKPILELIINSILKGEEIKIVDDNQLISQI